MKKLNVFSIVITGLFAAMVAITTMSITVPSPSPSGYIHIGDSMVYMTGMLLGPVLGPIAAGMGSAIADLILGYYLYIPATLVIKALDALAVALIFTALSKKSKSLIGLMVAYVFATLVGGTVMVSGYYLYETIMMNAATAIPNVIPNIFQAVGGAILGLPVFVALQKGKVFDLFKKRMVV